MISLNSLEIQVFLKNNSLSMKELIIAIGLLLFIEGMLYALFPSKMKNMFKMIEKLPVGQLRISGLIFAIIGFAIIWYTKR